MSNFFQKQERIDLDKLQKALDNESMLVEIFKSYFSKDDKVINKTFGIIELDSNYNISLSTTKYQNGQLAIQNDIYYIMDNKYWKPLANYIPSDLIAKVYLIDVEASNLKLLNRRPNTPITILLMGGGGSGSTDFLINTSEIQEVQCTGGGGGGYLTIKNFSTQEAELFETIDKVTIGKGGGGKDNDNLNGGTTMITFTYNGQQQTLSAKGGEAGSSIKGGDGGSGGGGPGGSLSKGVQLYKGGDAQYGGGGGGGSCQFDSINIPTTLTPSGGASNKYTFLNSYYLLGGGGGSGLLQPPSNFTFGGKSNGENSGGEINNSGRAIKDILSNKQFFNTPAIFSNYTSILTTSPFNFHSGNVDDLKTSTGGGSKPDADKYFGGGGGGGYGSVGGNGGTTIEEDNMISIAGAGGGGGGFGALAYGGNGGDQKLKDEANVHDIYRSGGGGGGFGGPGGSGCLTSGGGGGGYSAVGNGGYYEISSDGKEVIHTPPHLGGGGCGFLGRNLYTINDEGNKVLSKHFYDLLGPAENPDPDPIIYEETKGADGLCIIFYYV